MKAVWTNISSVQAFLIAYDMEFLVFLFKSVYGANLRRSMSCLNQWEALIQCLILPNAHEGLSLHLSYINRNRRSIFAQTLICGVTLAETTKLHL